jgi:NADH:ubiquinone oxidoreductase subunit 6 (subunit J)
MGFYCFNILTGLCLISAFLVVTSKNPIHSVFFLVFLFFNTAGLLILLGVEFLAMLFLIVYVGAVAVLFLFVMMMLNIKISESSNSIYRYLPIGLFLSILFLFEIFIIVEGDLNSIEMLAFTQSKYLLLENQFVNNVCWVDNVIASTNVDVIGSVLFTFNVYFFIITSFILLVSMIGAITLTLHRRSDIRRQEIFKQLQRDFERATILKR